MLKVCLCHAVELFAGRSPFFSSEQGLNSAPAVVVLCRAVCKLFLCLDKAAKACRLCAMGARVPG